MDENLRKRIEESRKKLEAKKNPEKADGSMQGSLTKKFTPVLGGPKPHTDKIRETVYDDVQPEDASPMFEMTDTPLHLLKADNPNKDLLNINPLAGEEIVKKPFKPQDSSRFIPPPVTVAIDGDDQYTAIVAIIKEERVKRKISRAAMGVILEMTGTNYYNIERGKTKLTLETVVKICKVLEIKITINGVEI
ncbi:MAG TPA: helix-turn-helix domain-containing protein [Candidatus Wunengus sp. YC60]|uniref:helix-turn-helix domain-containing protein n=1 Tax=Candidatus Wunengus sp. YC60 TaxID=3367697 RepID=UPI00402683B4